MWLGRGKRRARVCSLPGGRAWSRSGVAVVGRKLSQAWMRGKGEVLRVYGEATGDGVASQEEKAAV